MIAECKNSAIGDSSKDCETLELPLLMYTGISGHLGKNGLSTIEYAIHEWYELYHILKDWTNIYELNEAGVPSGVLSAFFSVSLSKLEPPYAMQGLGCTEQRVPIQFIDMHVYFKELDFTDKLIYAAGCLEGMKEGFKPLFDTPNGVKELVMKEIRDHISGFEFSVNFETLEKTYKKSEFRTHGKKVGRKYLAWIMVFENPDYFTPDLRKTYLWPKETPSKANDKLTLVEVAILYYYKVESITQDNGDEIAMKYGHASGKKLAQEYATYRSDKVKDRGTLQKNKNLLKRLEKVRPLLDEDCLERFSADMDALKSTIEDY